MCFASSANYLINEFVDAKSDSFHPDKKMRPAVQIQISTKTVFILYFFWSGLALLLSLFISQLFYILSLYLILGLFYNIKPVRLKDRQYLDIISESANNPIRFLVGWICLVSPTEILPPFSLILGYWFLGSFLMAAKRFSELNQLSQSMKRAQIILYRKSFDKYNQKKLYFIVHISAYLGILCFSVFSIKYNPLFIIFTSIISFWLADYGASISDNLSAAQNPELLTKRKLNYFFAIFVLLSFILPLFISVQSFNDLVQSTNLNLEIIWKLLWK